MEGGRVIDGGKYGENVWGAKMAILHRVYKLSLYGSLWDTF